MSSSPLESDVVTKYRSIFNSAKVFKNDSHISVRLKDAQIEEQQTLPQESKTLPKL